MVGSPSQVALTYRMKYLWPAIVAFLTACTASAPPVPKRTYTLSDMCTEGARGVIPGTVKVHVSDGLCSGVVISPTEVLTAGHCVENVEWATVEFPGGVFVPAPEAAVNGPYGEDSALLHVAVPAGQTIVPVADPPKYGAEVWFSGFGCDHDVGAVRKGYARLREIPEVHANKYTGCVCKGDSGGPVFSKDGVVGVITHHSSNDRTWVTETSALPWLRALLATLPVSAP